MPFIVAAFYHFFDFPDFAQTRAPLKGLLDELQIKGSLLIAGEGINGTLSGRREAIDRLLDYLKTEIVRGEFAHKESLCERQPFGRAKVRLKKEIISLGEKTPSLTLPREGAGEGTPRTGQYVEPKDWNALIADPGTLVIDARNAYEIHLGTFTGAVDPGTRSFKQLPAYVRKHLDPAQHKKIATFCTGGIRCEKFSSWLLEQGFGEVYQLKGGILKYLEDIPESDSSWRGECYVFDERVAVGHGLAASQTASMCRACGHALTEEDRAHENYMQGKGCGFCCVE